jgi:crotonobetainyl-CoA:carnitine CoA-transferase CaiB-like acyl-CoA transferase
MQEIFALSRVHRFPAAPVRDLHAIQSDKELRQQQSLREVEHPLLGRIVLPNSPLRFAGLRREAPELEPGLGEHRAEILADVLGLDDSEIGSLSEAGAF